MTTRKIPMRQCTGCRQLKPKKELIRVLLTPEGETVIDTTGKKNGRGAYICPTKECLRLAIKSKGLEKSLKTSISDSVYAFLEKEMTGIEQ